jgi:hypothetical protein
MAIQKSFKQFTSLKLFNHTRFNSKKQILLNDYVFMALIIRYLIIFTLKNYQQFLRIINLSFGFSYFKNVSPYPET